MELEENTKEVGKYKPSIEFRGFLSASHFSKVRIYRDYAYIDGDKLSGVLDGSKFKITICGGGTVNFEVVENNSSIEIDDGMINRLLENISERDIVGYAQKFIISGLEFRDGDGNLCYLEVEHKKPIDKFYSILESIKKEDVDKKLSDRGFNILDALFSSESDAELEREFEGEYDGDLEEKEAVELKESSPNKSYIEESFREMNENKIKELRERISNSKKEANRIKGEISQSESKLKNIISDIGVLETRLESMSALPEPIGWVFNISEEQKAEDVGLTEENRKIADKIADLLGLKKDTLFNMLTEGFYKIRIAKCENIDSGDFELNSDLLEAINFLDVNGKIIMVNRGEFEYRGDLNWHQLVDKMIKSGFKQDPEFDKKFL